MTRLLCFFAIFQGASLLALQAQAVSLADFGAKGDGLTDDSSAFTAAFNSGKKIVLMPSGIFLVGPKVLTVPENTTIMGEGLSSVIKMKDGTTALFQLSSGDRIKDMVIDGTLTAKPGPPSPAVVSCAAGHNVEVSGVGFQHVKGGCISTDKAEDFSVQDCRFESVGTAILIQFSKRVNIRDNRVLEAADNGIEMWGSWQWFSRQCEDLTVSGNYLKNAGSAGIFGIGVERAIFANNIVDGIKDVGIDMEWASDSVIAGNSVANCANAGISLFFACQGISITGNIIDNNRPPTPEETKAKWWVRSGIWLTYPNRATFPNDQGHRDVTIVGNTINCAPGIERRAIWIGSESKNIVLGMNSIHGGKIVEGGINSVNPMVLKDLSDNSVVDAAPSQASDKN